MWRKMCLIKMCQKCGIMIVSISKNILKLQKCETSSICSISYEIRLTPNDWYSENSSFLLHQKLNHFKVDCIL